jgi:hypothetical protein
MSEMPVFAKSGVGISGHASNDWSIARCVNGEENIIENPMQDVFTNQSLILYKGGEEVPSNPRELQSIESHAAKSDLNNRKVFDWWSTQVSDSDEENWFVPRFSKRRIASTVHTLQMPDFMDGHSEKRRDIDKLPVNELTEVDLSSIGKKTGADKGRGFQKKTWGQFTSKLLPTRERRNKRSNEKCNNGQSSEDDDTTIQNARPTYLPPFQIVGRIDEPEELCTSKPARNIRPKIKALKQQKTCISSHIENDGKKSKLTVIYSHFRTRRTEVESKILTGMNNVFQYQTPACNSNLTSSMSVSEKADKENIGNSTADTTHEMPKLTSSSVSNFVEQPSYVHIPDQVRDFRVSCKEEDSDSSWIMQTSSNTLVR